MVILCTERKAFTGPQAVGIYVSADSRFDTSRWSAAVHVDHVNGQHGDNVVENLQLLWAEGSDGHGARSIRQRFA